MKRIWWDTRSCNSNLLVSYIIEHKLHAGMVVIKNGVFFFPITASSLIKTWFLINLVRVGRFKIFNTFGILMLDWWGNSCFIVNQITSWWSMKPFIAAKPVHTWRRFINIFNRRILISREKVDDVGWPTVHTTTIRRFDKEKANHKWDYHHT